MDHFVLGTALKYIERMELPSGIMNGKIRRREIIIDDVIERKDSTLVGIDLFEHIEDVNLHCLCFLPEFVEVMGRDETDVVS